MQLEIDFSFAMQLRPNPGQPGNFPDDATLPYGSGLMDAQLVLYDSQGNTIALNDNIDNYAWGDGGSSLDPNFGAKSTNTIDPDNAPESHEPYLDLVLQPGTYVVEVTKFDPETLGILLPPEDGDEYTLHVSVENHPVDPGAEATNGGYSYFFGTSLGGPVLDATPTDGVQIFSPRHGLLGGETVYVEGVQGIRLANGTYQVNAIDEDNFELVDADGTDDPFSPDGPYRGGGTWRLVEMPEDQMAAISSVPFSLVGYAPQDKPVLYFNYLANLDVADPTQEFTVSMIVDGGAPSGSKGQSRPGYRAGRQGYDKSAHAGTARSVAANANRTG